MNNDQYAELLAYLITIHNQLLEVEAKENSTVSDLRHNWQVKREAIRDTILDQLATP
ncbi:MAG: hypothetical protein IPM48_14275 [Saprospiraceae bacterium]|nr:hypothetical protein [Saprospiraceae bacterium]